MDFSESEKKDRLLEGFTLTEDSEPIFVYGSGEEHYRSFFQRLEDFFIDRSRVSLKEKAYFFHLMSVMIDAGVSIVKALHILARKLKTPRFKRVLGTAARDVDAGKNLSDAMARFPDVFHEGEVEVVRSGETVGNLEKMFERLSQQVADDYTLRLKIRSALTYPVMVLIVLFIAILVVVTLVVPNLMEFFTLNNAEVPFITIILIRVSNFMTSYWWTLIFAFISLHVFFQFYISTEEGKFRFDMFQLRFPFFGMLKRKIILARLLRLLSVLLTSGLSMIKVSEILIRSAGNDVYKRKLREVDWKIRHGERFVPGLESSSFLFPSIVSAVLDIGERAGTLDQAAEKVSKHYEQEVIHSIQEVTSLIEPVLIVIVGLGVLFVALALLAPIFSLSSLV
ncbi:type II secretion system F family protein [Candidatus Peregrinibacteria bacterium]|nr:type II secretion system F family protein [Candidatus Peregrinibacteria bacterium]